MFTGKNLLTAFFLLFAAMTLAQGPKKATGDKIVAIVGDHIILHSAIKNSIAEMVSHGNPAPDSAECTMIEQAVLSKLLMLQGEKDSLPIDDDEINAALDNRIRGLISYYGTQKAVEDLAGKPISQIKSENWESIREQMLAQSMQQKIVSGVKITPAEVKTYFDNIPVAQLPFIESEMEIGQIVIYPKASAEIEEYIVSELNRYKKQVETKFTSFEQLAKRYSEHPSKERGGQCQVSRNEKIWDQAFLSACFRLKEREVSAPVKSPKAGYFLIQMIEKNGDDAMVRIILRIPPVGETEVEQAANKLNVIRSKLLYPASTFSEAATQYSEDEMAKFMGPFLHNQDGSTHISINELDKETLNSVKDLKEEEVSKPVVFTDGQGKKGLRILYLKSRSKPHRLNMTDDYTKISDLALGEKRAKALDKWVRTITPTYYIMIEETIAGKCPLVKKYANAN
jgi:peptidyl-prolyl cis-trans isomerase SurA